MESTAARRVGDGVAGRAVAEGRLVVAEDYGAPPTPWRLRRPGITAAMAAPVHEDGRVTGSLILSSFRPGRVFSRAEQDMLRSFAEHASLALTDARRVDAMLHQALHDSLTGLPNRALFTDRDQQLVARPVAERVVDGLEAVEVEEDHAAGAFRWRRGPASARAGCGR